MSQLKKIFLLSTTLVLINSCSWILRNGDGNSISSEIPRVAKEVLRGTKKLSPEYRKEVMKYIQNRCIEHKFDSGEENHLYGKECLQGQKIVIRTGKIAEAEPVSNFSAVIEGESHGVRTEMGKEPDFINKVYKLPYSLVSDHEDNSPVSWLKALLSKEKKDFIGLPETEYHIIFEILGNYLVLFKASKKLEDIPSMERTSIPHDEETKRPSVDKDGFYKLPFLGYKIKSCYTEHKKTPQGEYTNSHRLVCNSNKENLESLNSMYIEGLDGIGKNIKNTGKIKYITLEGAPEPYKMPIKKNLFPTDYFDGEWFLAFGLSEMPLVDGELPPENAFHVRLNKTDGYLEAQDISGSVPDNQRHVIPLLPVEWVDYELNKEGGNFINFGEILDKNLISTQTNYLKIQFDKFGAFNKKFGSKQTPSETNITDLLVTKNYFSFKARAPYTYTVRREDIDGSPFGSTETKTVTAIYQYSLLRKSALDTKGFLPRRFYREDSNKYFGVLSIEPQDIARTGESTASDLRDHVRMIRFNTSLNSEEEKASNTKIIKWYFSKKSSKKDRHRDLARQAINIYNRAFELIRSEESDTKIRMELIEDPPKDLGDLRYNIINLIDREENSGVVDSILGFAPSYIYADTGQIISSSTNVFIQNTEEIYIEEARRYTRHKIFQLKNPIKNPTNSMRGQEVASEYIKTQIEKKCDSLIKYIDDKKKSIPLPLPDKALNDKDELITCGKKLAEEHILNVILHEMGHSLGLAHNFKASLDKANYYKSVDEINQICPNTKDFEIARSFIFSDDGKIKEYPKSSSVMDYLPSGIRFLSCLGKYDLAALRFLYNEELETKDGGTVALNLVTDPLQQGQLSDKGRDFLNKVKTYQHCSDWLNADNQRLGKGIEESTLCAKWDYGSSPKEIVEYYIDRIKRDFNSRRYRYDRSSGTVNNVGSWISSGNRDLTAIKFLYGKWVKLKDSYLNSIGERPIYRIASGEQSATTYREVINGGKGGSKQYARYFEIREPIYEFLTDILFQESMQCELAECTRWNEDKNCSQYEEETKRFVNLQTVALRESIHRRADKPFYVENCYSPDIKEFFRSQDLTITGEKGIEDFKFYNFVEGQEHVSQEGWNIIPYNVSHNFLTIQNLGDNIFSDLMKELDLFEDFKVRLFKSILEPKVSLNRTDLVKIKNIYNELFLKNLNSIKQEDSDVFEQNQNYLQSVILREGLGTNSFHSALNMSLSSNSVELLPFPFVRDVYRCHFKGEEDAVCSDWIDRYAAPTTHLLELWDENEVSNSSVDLQNNNESSNSSVDLQNNNESTELNELCPLPFVASGGDLPLNMSSLEIQTFSHNKGQAIDHLTKCLVSLNETLRRESGSLVFPFSIEGFAADAIRTYNDNLRAIELLTDSQQEALNPFQEMELSFREEYKNQLDEIIQSISHSSGGPKFGPINAILNQVH